MADRKSSQKQISSHKTYILAWLPTVSVAKSDSTLCAGSENILDQLKWQNGNTSSEKAVS